MPWTVTTIRGSAGDSETPKAEFFHGCDWGGASVEEFMSGIDAHIRWYNERRIKLTLDGMSPVEYRESIELMAT